MKIDLIGIPENCLVSYRLEQSQKINYHAQLHVFRKPVDKSHLSVYDFPSVEMVTEIYYIHVDSFELYDDSDDLAGKIAFI